MSAARSIGTGRRRVVGDRLVDRDAVAVCAVRCSCCSRESREEIVVDEPLARQLADMSCMYCGRLGRMSVVPS